MEKKATRDSYGEALVMLAEKRPDLVVLDADLAAATKTGIFKKAHPDRFFDCGIAEANMMGVAAGIASTGKLVFASSFAMFAAGRAFEIIRARSRVIFLPCAAVVTVIGATPAKAATCARVTPFSLNRAGKSTFVCARSAPFRIPSSARFL